MRIAFVSVFPTLCMCIGLGACTAKQPASEASGSAKASTAATPPRGETAKDRDHIDPDGVVRRGDAMSERPALSVSKVLEKAEQLDGTLVKVKGTVGKVCSKSGCWFELKGQGADQGIRITSKGYRFFVPSKAGGMSATLEGDLKVRMLDVATAQHYADDAAQGTGKPAEKITQPVPEVSIAAVSVEMRES